MGLLRWVELLPGNAEDALFGNVESALLGNAESALGEEPPEHPVGRAAVMVVRNVFRVVEVIRTNVSPPM